MSTPTAYFRAALKYLLKAKGLSQKNFAGNTGTSKTYLNDVIKGRAPGKEATRVVWSKALGHTYDDMLNLGQWILEGNKCEDWVKPVHGNLNATFPAFEGGGKAEHTPATEPANFRPPPYHPNPPRHIPLISWVQAGDWQDAEDPFQPGQADEWFVTVETSSPRAFALIVHGDSMEPVFSEDDIITVDPDLDPLNNDYVIAKNGEEATFKQLVIDGSSVYLKPANERYPIKDMTGLDFVIVGVVVEKRKKFR